jgi:hypothetical protein
MFVSGTPSLPVSGPRRSADENVVTTKIAINAHLWRPSWLRITVGSSPPAS